MPSQLRAALCLLVCSAASAAASTLATFADAKCQAPLTRLAGNNGYPDGLCTNIAGAANADVQSFMFTALDAGCNPTIYLKDTTSDICSGEAEIGYISNCYNASWVYYSIDMCTSPDGSSSTSASPPASSTASASAVPVAASNPISGGAIAGAVVGSVCGLGIIAAVSAYFFWFRPRQRERKRREIEESGVRDAAGTRRKEEEDDKGHLINMLESHQPSHELQSMPDVAEAPGNDRANEMGNDGEVPVELPGDHEYGSSRDQRPRP